RRSYAASIYVSSLTRRSTDLGDRSRREGTRRSPRPRGPGAQTPDRFGGGRRSVHGARAPAQAVEAPVAAGGLPLEQDVAGAVVADRKSTRLHSSHVNISYAVF